MHRFPSQMNEHWAMAPQVLEKFAVHYKTGEVMPKAMGLRIVAARKFNQGFEMVELIACAQYDMELHQAGEGPIDPSAFERTFLAKIDMPTEIVMRHRQFGHMFSSDDYSAGNYAYL